MWPCWFMSFAAVFAPDRQREVARGTNPAADFGNAAFAFVAHPVVDEQHAYGEVAAQGFDECGHVSSLIAAFWEGLQPLFQSMQLQQPADDVVDVAFHRVVEAHVQCQPCQRPP